MDEYLRKVQSEVDEMNRLFQGGTETPGTDAPVEEPIEEPKTSPPATEAPTEELIEEPKTAPPPTDPPKTEAPTTDAPVEDEKDKIIEELRTKVGELEGKKAGTEEPKTTAPTTDAPVQLDEQDFMKDIDFDEVTRDPEKFNKFLNDFRHKIVLDTRKILGEGVLRSIPDIVKTNIVTMTNLQRASEKFYEDNEDLKPFKSVVAAVFEELASENPDKSYGEILKEVEPEVRKRLELHRKATSQPKQSDPPKLPRKKAKSGRAQEEPSISGIEKELNEMDKALGR